MSLTALPEEVLEIIILHLNAEDVLNALSAVGRQGSEVLWRKVCLKHGYKNHGGKEESWKNIFRRTINWMRGRYFRKVYNVDELVVENVSDRGYRSCSPIPVALESDFQLKNHTILSQSFDNVLVRSVETPYKLTQKLHGTNKDSCNLSTTKLLLTTGSSLVVYSYEKPHYRELITISNVGLFHSYKLGIFVLTDDYFVILKADEINVMIFDFKRNEEYSLACSHKKVRCFDVYVCDHILGLKVLEGMEYVLRLYNLENKEWAGDYVLSRNAVVVGIPRVCINSRVMVSWCYLLERTGVSPLKVWTSGGGSTFTRMENFVGRPDTILWLKLEENYVIYSSSTTSLAIVNVSKPGRAREIALLGIRCYAQNIVSGFLVLSYHTSFALIDFRKGAYLYNVRFENGFSGKPVLVNEYFYIACNEYLDDVGLQKMCIYDFRGDPFGGDGYTDEEEGE